MSRRMSPVWKPLEARLDRERIRRLYDRIGVRYDLLRFAEDLPKRAALSALAPRPGERAREVGVGSGWVISRLAEAICGVARTSPAAPPALAVYPASRTEAAPGAAPLVCGVDLSRTMLGVTRQRLRDAGLSPCVELRQADACALPYPAARFDLAFIGYVLDLLSGDDIARALGELWRTLRPGGRLAVIALSPGKSRPARLVTTAWEALYRVNPALLAGCRPIEPASYVQAAGFRILGVREWFRGYPSTLVIAARPGTADA